MEHNLKGYVFNKNGTHGAPININTDEDMSKFLLDNIETAHELRVVDSEDFTVFQATEKVLIYPLPKGASEKNCWNSEMKRFMDIR